MRDLSARRAFFKFDFDVALFPGLIVDYFTHTYKKKRKEKANEVEEIDR